MGAKIFLAFILAGLVPTSLAQAQTWGATGMVTSKLVDISPANSCCFCGYPTLSTNSTSDCDTNDRTADEVRQCKLDYWRKESERLHKSLEDAQHSYDRAQDRVRAFENQK